MAINTTELEERALALMEGNRQQGITGTQWAKELGLVDPEAIEEKCDNSGYDLGILVFGMVMGYILCMHNIDEKKPSTSH